ncbi:MAG: TIGR00730 family Rossman fold protein [Christensenellaceae bacterium]
MKNICVFGSSSSTLHKIYYEDAYLLGSLIAKNGYGLVFGAGDMGMMGSCARGVHSIEGGHVTGVIPSFMNTSGIAYSKCDELIITESMRERKRQMEELSQVFVTVAGGFGTFEELFEVITLKQLVRHKKQILILNTNGYYNKLIGFLDECVTQNFSNPQNNMVYTVVNTPQEVMTAIKNYQYSPLDTKRFSHTNEE